MKYFFLFSVLLICLTSIITPQNKNLRESLRRVHQIDNQKGLRAIKFHIEKNEAIHKKHSLNKHNKGEESNEIIFRPVKFTKNGHDTVNYATEFVTYTYDNSGNPLTEITQQIQAGVRINRIRINYTYDNQGNNLTDLYEKWEDSAWVNIYKYTSTYDDAGNLITNIEEMWKDSKWENVSRYTTTYDDSGRWLTELLEFWDNGDWVNDARYTASRDNSGNLLTDLSEIWFKDAWINDFKTSYTYENNGNSILEIDQIWEDGEWVDFFRFSATYNNGFWLTELYEDYDDSTNSWVPTYRYTATYDNSNNLLVDLAEEWTGDTWVNFVRRIYNYDNNNNSIHGENFVWRNNAWRPEQGTLVLYYDNHDKSLNCTALVADIEYTSFVISGVDDEQSTSVSFSLAQNYPNPFNPVTNISFSLPRESNVNLKVYDLLGNEIITLLDEHKSSGTHHVQFNGGSLSSGVYFYKIETGEFTSTKKLILMK